MLVDIDGDDDLDLASCNFAGASGASVTVIPQIAPGRFAELPRVVGEAVAGTLPFTLGAEDLDHDGDLDLLLGSSGGLTLFHGGR